MTCFLIWQEEESRSRRKEEKKDLDAQAKAKSCEKRSARAKAAAEKAEKLRAKAKLAEEKAERAKQKLEGKGKGKGNKRPKKCHVDELDAGVDGAPAAEPVKPPTTRKRRKQPDAHAPVETPVPADPKKLKVQQAFLDLLATGIEDLKTELGDRKSFTVKPAPDLRCRAAPGWPSPIGVVLVSKSFYVNRCMVAKESWPKELLDLYTVGI